MLNFCKVPAAVLAIFLLGASGSLLAQPAIGLPESLTAVSTLSPELRRSIPVELAEFETLESARPLLAASSAQALPGLQLASNEPEMSPLLAPMLAFYSQLLSLDSAGSNGIALTRLQARLGDKASEKTALLDINDVLAADIDAVEVLAVGRSELEALGVPASAVASLPLLTSLLSEVKTAMMELPQGLASMQGSVAMAVWGEENGKPVLASLVVRAN